MDSSTTSFRRNSRENILPSNCHSYYPERKSLAASCLLIEPRRSIIEFRHLCPSLSSPNRHSRNVLTEFAQQQAPAGIDSFGRCSARGGLSNSGAAERGGEEDRLHGHTAVNSLPGTEISRCHEGRPKGVWPLRSGSPEGVIDYLVKISRGPPRPDKLPGQPKRARIPHPASRIRPR